MDSGPHGLTLGVLRPHLVVSWQSKERKLKPTILGKEALPGPQRGSQLNRKARAQGW